MLTYMLSQLVTNAFHKIHRNTKTQQFGDGKMKNKFGECRNTFICYITQHTVAKKLCSITAVLKRLCLFRPLRLFKASNSIFDNRIIFNFLLIVTVNVYHHLNCKFQSISVMLFTRKNLMRTAMVQYVSASFANIQVVLPHDKIVVAMQ